MTKTRVAQPRDPSTGRFVSEEDREPEEDNYCSSCAGTGMPSSGPPDVGCCSSCGGSGIAASTVDVDDFEYDDDYYDDYDDDYVDYIYDPYGGY